MSDCEVLLNRDLASLTEREYDLLIVGGGIFGACAAWDAVLRGLSVALVERRDFASGASAHSFKMVHGGIRYLQHADIGRLRASCFERSALLRVAPHLVEPLPILIPTYGHGRAGKEFLGTGMLLYDLLTLDRNRGIADATRRVPCTGFLSRREVLSHFPDIPDRGLTGGAVFRDGQMYNPTRLALAFLQSAAGKGVQLANYAEVTRLLRKGDRIAGVEVLDSCSKESFCIRSRAVLNVAGGWSEEILATDDRLAPRRRGIWSRDACFVIPRRFESEYALAVQGSTRDPDAVLSRAARHFFVVPWRDYTLVGVWHHVYEGAADDTTVGEEELETFLDDINAAYPALSLELSDVNLWNAGLVPFGENAKNAVNLRYGKHSRLVDHEKEQGIKGLVSLMGIRYTMARGDAANAVDLVCTKLGRSLMRPPTYCLPVHGGDIESFEALVGEARHVSGTRSPGDRVVRALVHNHGSNYRTILELASREEGLEGVVGESTVLKAEIVHAVRHEMALTLCDLVFRRTDLATGQHPGDEALAQCASLAGTELGWTASRVETELEDVKRTLASRRARSTAGW